MYAYFTDFKIKNLKIFLAEWSGRFWMAGQQRAVTLKRGEEPVKRGFLKNRREGERSLEEVRMAGTAGCLPHVRDKGNVDGRFGTLSAAQGVTKGMQIAGVARCLLRVYHRGNMVGRCCEMSPACP